MQDTENSRWYESAADLLRMVVPRPCAGLTPYDSRRFSRFLAMAAGTPPSTRTLLLRAVVVEDRLVGVADWRLLGHVLFLNGIAVAPEHRGAGIGRALLDDGLDVARRLGCVALELDVAEGNTAARQLYKGAGFMPAGASTWLELPNHPPASHEPPSAAPTHPPAGAEEPDGNGWRLRNWPAFVVHHRAYGFGDLEVSSGGKLASVRLLPGGWRISDAENSAAITQAVASAVGRWPERLFRISAGGRADTSAAIEVFRRLRLPL
jgi:GNAT superfamily N-acetyltransferase